MAKRDVQRYTPGEHPEGDGVGMYLEPYGRYVQYHDYLRLEYELLDEINKRDRRIVRLCKSLDCPLIGKGGIA